MSPRKTFRLSVAARATTPDPDEPPILIRAGAASGEAEAAALDRLDAAVADMTADMDECSG